MADNIAVTPGAGATVHADEYTHSVLGSGKTQLVKIVDGTLDSEIPLKVVVEDVALAGGEGGLLAMGQRKDVPASTAGTDGDATYPIYDSTGKQWVHPLADFITCSTDVTRPANTTTYTINDALADTTPTTGGFTFTGAARVSGGSGIITDMWVTFDEDAAVPLQGEVHIFEQAVTAITDNAAYAITDAEARTQIGKIPFALEDNGNQGVYHAQNLNIGFTAVGSANLRFTIKVKNGYIPTTNSSVITIRLKILQVN